VDNWPAHCPQAVRWTAASGTPVNHLAKISFSFIFLNKEGREKEVAKAPPASGLSYLSLRFKIGEPSCVATLKMT